MVGQISLKHRIADKRILRLIVKWLKAGVSEAGKWRKTEKGCPQGAVISPLLANIYLHYVLDLWTKAYRKKKVKGEAIIVRYCDDYIVGFQYEQDARHYLELLQQRSAKFNLALHPDKTRLIRFGRLATAQGRKRGTKKPETLTAIKESLMKRRHDTVISQGQWLRSVVQGYFNYFAVPGNLKTLESFRRETYRNWLRVLRRRSQRHRLTWDRFQKLVKLFIPSVRVVHPYPHSRFDAKYSR